MASLAWTEAVAAVSGAVTSGASLIQNMAGAPEYRVYCTINIENWTKYPLVDPKSYIDKGILKSPPVVVRPGEKESFVGHKEGYSTNGTSGTASWLIEGQDRRVVVMWSCPYSFDFYTNWLGVGLARSGSQRNEGNFFNQMYYENNGNGLSFDRGDYYNNTKTLSMKEENIEVTGTMGTGHHSTAHIIVRPLLKSDLAPSIMAKMILLEF